MNLLKRFLKSQGFVDRVDLRSAYRRGLREGIRSFTGARSDRSTADWLNTGTTVNRDLRGELVELRNRARDLTKNDPYARRFTRLCRMNVVGPNGFRLQVYAKDPPSKEFPTGKPDYVANAIMEREFALWSRRSECTMGGQLTFRGVQDLVIQTFAREGEFLVQKIFDKESRYGFRLHVLDNEMLDETLNTKLQNGNAVRMGIEFDKWSRPIAYYFKQGDVGLETYSSYGMSQKRIPASEIYHQFDIEYASQARGFSVLAPVMIRMRMLQKYEEAALINARIGAAKMGFFETDPEKATGEGYSGTDVDAGGNKITDVEAGSFEELPVGMKLSAWNPEFPSEQHEPFVKSMLRGVASGLGTSYNMLANDLEGVNYGSLRGGLLDERENWMAVQRWFIESFLEPVFQDWLENAMLKSAVPLPFGKFDKFNAPVWIGRRWAWIDPLKDVQAQKEAVQAGFKTRTQVIAEGGDDREDVDLELALEKASAEKLGLKLSVYDPNFGKSAPAPPPEKEE